MSRSTRVSLPLIHPHLTKAGLHLCRMFQLDAESLHTKWSAFALSQDEEKISLEALDRLKQHIQRSRCLKSNASKIPTNLASLKTPGKVFTTSTSVLANGPKMHTKDTFASMYAVSSGYEVLELWG